MKNIIIAGGSGLVGNRLAEMLINKGFSVTILTRNKTLQSTNNALTYSYWNVELQQINLQTIATAYTIINLAGEGVVNKRWTTKQKQLIVDSRVDSCKLIVSALQQTNNTVATVICASAIGWYKPQINANTNTNQYQENEEANNDFLGNTCKLWEQSIEPITQLNKRLVKFRIGIVLSKNGGALKEFLKPIKLGIAAILGNQNISWIHIDDLCNMFIAAIENENYKGVYNAVAPMVTTNAKLNICLAKKVKGKFFIAVKVPPFIIKLMLGEMSVEVLKSSTISCKKIMDNGYKFLYPTIDEAIKELIG